MALNAGDDFDQDEAEEDAHQHARADFAIDQLSAGSAIARVTAEAGFARRRSASHSGRSRA